ncbi:uncharacterized protein A4U43_C07F15310 [Asparagus officinalis]|uniref:Glucan endo-1,3-beta-D-glucosidase n=1 Tax=Asparagus officinalis TaxID=4686 RepID=A0A5P1ECF0_ASPOF|nr:putative glucan endo-1,3-beta-glucosidase GVI [Asparagus officinalis]ONK63453.1 uncharacterized protein A4U43_C07F15310 [Asparagus officinalis]
MEHYFLCVVAFGVLISAGFLVPPETEAIGINYGLLGNNLPPPDKVISLYKSRNITSLRLFNPNSTIITSLQNSNMDVILGTYNQDLQNLAKNPSFASQWVNTNILPYTKSVNFKYVSAGNEVIPGDLEDFVLPAMKNLDAALQNAGLEIPVTTAVSTQVLNVSYPPSKGEFRDIMTPLVAFLEAKKSPLLVNVYPYFAYSGDPQNVQLDYALFTANTTVVHDGPLGYSNLFDAILDATYTALEKVGGSNVDIVVSETGWPSGGNGLGATIENAKIYNNNVVAHIEKNAGTPKKPGKKIETYLFAMFNENEKPAGTEQNFGLYHPDMTEVYHVDFSS